MSQITSKLKAEAKKPLNDGIDDISIIVAAASVEDYFFYEPQESKEEILEQLEGLGITVAPPTTLEKIGWKEAAVLPHNVQFDQNKIEKIVIVQVDEGLFSLRISTKDGHLEEQKFGQGRNLDLTRFHDLLILVEG